MAEHTPPSPRREAKMAEHMLSTIPVDDRMKSTLPEGAAGHWRVERFEVTEDDARMQRIRAMNPSSMGRYVPDGQYTALYRGNALIMSDTPDEIRDHMEFIRRAHGRVLINGLGLGICAGAVLRKSTTTLVRIVEIAEEVIELVGSHFHDPRLEIVHADAHEYKPAKGERFDFVWHDIWSDICTDNLDSMKVLHRKYGRRCQWQGSWCRATVGRLARTGW